jgi:hypothetical protein
MDQFHFTFAVLKILEQPVLHKFLGFHSGVIKESSLLGSSIRSAVYWIIGHILVSGP